MKGPAVKKGGAPLGRYHSLSSSAKLIFCALAAATAAPSAIAQTEPYSYYGGEIETEEKNAAIENCEYQVLVEEQRCNRRANKSACIKEVHRECREKYQELPESQAKEKPQDN
ncbi:hypothetical protein [Congregibacter sp.]|uniref:hypothetical protein n=1 Tax=Congregibacter sp. TaxID=2744308 RepID=UPI003F6B86C4